MIFSRWLPTLLTVSALTVAPAAVRAQSLTVVYQTVPTPSLAAQAGGDYEKATGAKIAWRKFDSGAEVINAVASGDVQIAYLGSSPLAAAVNRKLPIEVFLIAAQLDTSEQLVARNGTGIDKPQDLVGKKVAVPFVSTGHYSLLAALKHWKIDPRSVNIVNLSPPNIATREHVLARVFAGQVQDTGQGQHDDQTRGAGQGRDTTRNPEDAVPA